MHLVQQPEQKLLRVVLCGAAKLGAVPIHDRLKARTVLWRVPARPQRLQDERQLFRELALRAELFRVYLVAALQVSL